MSTGFEAAPTTEQIENDRITYDLLVYVFGYMPNVSETVLLDQIAEDLEETPETILQAMDELRLDGLLNFTQNHDIVTITHKDERFLQEHTVYESIRY